MKVKLLVNKGDIKKGEIFEARVIPFMLGSAYQCIDGRLMGVSFQPNDVIELDELPISQEEVTELKQENLQRMEEVKGLQAELDKAKRYGQDANALGLRARNELIFAESNVKRLREDLSSINEGARNKHESLIKANNELSRFVGMYKAEREARIYLEATLERAMLDQQSVVLPKEVAEAIEICKTVMSGVSIVGSLDIIDKLFRDYDESILRSLSAIKYFVHKEIGGGQDLMSALVNGYVVEPEPEKIILSIEMDKAIKYALNTHWYRGKEEYLLKVHRNKSNSPFHNEMYALNNISTDLLEKALVNGYTVESPEEANEAAFRKGMEAIYEEMDNEPFNSFKEKREELATRLIPLIKEIYQH